MFTIYSKTPFVIPSTFTFRVVNVNETQRRVGLYVFPYWKNNDSHKLHYIKARVGHNY